MLFEARVARCSLNSDLGRAQKSLGTADLGREELLRLVTNVFHPPLFSCVFLRRSGCFAARHSIYFLSVSSLWDLLMLFALIGRIVTSWEKVVCHKLKRLFQEHFCYLQPVANISRKERDQWRHTIAVDVFVTISWSFMEHEYLRQLLWWPWLELLWAI